MGRGETAPERGRRRVLLALIGSLLVVSSLGRNFWHVCILWSYQNVSLFIRGGGCGGRMWRGRFPLNVLNNKTIMSFERPMNHMQELGSCIWEADLKGNFCQILASWFWTKHFSSVQFRFPILPTAASSLILRVLFQNVILNIPTSALFWYTPAPPGETTCLATGKHDRRSSQPPQQERMT